MASSALVVSGKEARRARISEVATTLFLGRGFDEVSIAEIAEAAGVSKMTVTNHFALKEDLVFDEFDTELVQIAVGLEGAVDIASAVDALEKYCEERERSGPVFRALRGIDGVSTWPRFARMILGSRALIARFHTHYVDVNDTIAEVLGRVVDADRLAVDAWAAAETVHLVDWWPVDAIRRGLAPAEIAVERVNTRRRAFHALRSGIVDQRARSR